jgi:DNA-directed RNA polymerase subunit RPC12/RpoP
MPALKRKVIRQVDGFTIEDYDETKKTKTMLTFSSINYLICDKCGKDLIVRKDQPVSIECSQCGSPAFHTSSKFSAQCVNCSNIQEVNKNFYGYCKKCNNKMWQIL